MARWFAFLLYSLSCAAGHVWADAHADPPAPKFSWDTVPQWLIIRKSIAYTPDEVKLIAAAPVVVFEKANGYSDAGSVEEGVLRAAKAVKAVNPSTVTFFYWNAVINYPHYQANDEFSKHLNDWAIKKNGKTFLFKDHYPIYKLTSPGFQQWWIRNAKSMAAHPEIDGVMIDAICKVGGRAFSDGPGFADTYFKTATRLKAQMGGKLLIGNAIRVGEPQDNMHHLKYLDGSYIENWLGPPEHIAQGMDAISKALEQKKLILFNSGPHALEREDPEKNSTDAENEQEMRMKQKIHFPLGVFLCFAEPGAYFHFGSGPDALPGPNQDVWRNDIYPELSRPLGKPRGPAKRDGFTYTRHFEHLDLQLDLKRREATFNWH